MLKYLFTATYSDGSTFTQNAEDKSAIDPVKRSAFYDVDHSKLVTFSLQGEGHSYLVDLRTGHFEIDGVIQPSTTKKPIENLRLIYYRQHTHTFKLGGQIPGAEGGEAKTRELDHSVVYVIGWQCTVDGENCQEVIRIT